MQWGLMDSQTFNELGRCSVPWTGLREGRPRPSGMAAHLVTSISSQESKGSVEVMRKDLNDARDLHGQAESAAAVWKASGSGPGMRMNEGTWVCTLTLSGRALGCS